MPANGATDWSKWPTLPAETLEALARTVPEYHDHIRQWERSREPVEVFRAGIDGRSGASISDVRSVYHHAQVLIAGVEVRAAYELKACLDRIQVLEQKIAGLERAAPKFCGHWQNGVQYDKGSLVHYRGSAWLATTTTTATPDDRSDDWSIFAKKGRDGRHGKDAT